MSSNQSASNCRKTCWYAAALAGVVLAVLLMLVGGWGFVTAVLGGIVGAIILGAVLTWTLCKDQAQDVEQAQGSAAPATAAVASGAATAAAASHVADEATDSEGTSRPEPVAEPATASSIIADANEGAEQTLLKPSTSLAGEAELAERKGSWRYEAPKSDASATAVAATAAASVATSETDASAGVDYDGDGVIEGAAEGTRPAALDGPRDGAADDLKQIKGVGPKMETLLNSLGFYHFDQVAGWSADEVAWVDANLEGFKGRVSRDDWVKQAKVLAAGGETEFSKKVEKGGVY